MIYYFLKRLAVAVPTLLILIVVSYVLMYAAPGGPFDTERTLTPEVMANLHHKYGSIGRSWCRSGVTSFPS